MRRYGDFPLFRVKYQGDRYAQRLIKCLIYVSLFWREVKSNTRRAGFFGRFFGLYGEWGLIKRRACPPGVVQKVERYRGRGSHGVAKKGFRMVILRSLSDAGHS